ncbi:serine hydrolase domain-containing protein, partial [Streptomyces boncukensis]
YKRQAHAHAAPGAGSGPVDRSIARYLARTLPAGPGGPGGTVVAARGGDLVHCAGFGLADRAAGTPADCDTVYDVMSVTKQFTAAAVLKLETQGRLRVTDRIGRFLGPVPRDKRRITLHQLLTHTAGLTEGLGDDYDPVSRGELVDGVLKSRLRSAPGTEFHYSNAGYSLLAAVIEKASGRSYERYLSANLFAPAGMTRTGYVLPDFDRDRGRDRIAVEYDGDGRARGRPLDHPWAADGPYWNLRGNGGMLSTGRDMFRWHRALSGALVLPPRAKRKLFRPYVGIPGGQERYGYGWGFLCTGDGRIAWHNGGNDWSFASFARTLRDGTMVYWTTNQAYQRGKWNLEEREFELLRGIADRARDDD